MADAGGAHDGDEVQRIISAAWDVLTRTGYENLKIQVVIRLAGVSIGSFYRHFTGKQELMAALLEQELRRATAILDDLTAKGTPQERVAAWVDAVVSLNFGRKAGPRAKWFTTMPSEVSAMVPRTPEVQTTRPLHEAIADGVDAGVFSSPDAYRDAFLIQAMCSRLDTGDATVLDEDRKAAVGYVVDFVLAALMNPARHEISLVSGGQPVKRPRRASKRTEPERSTN